jgi:hypothetical protein
MWNFNLFYIQQTQGQRPVPYWFLKACNFPHKNLFYNGYTSGEKLPPYLRLPEEAINAKTFY